MDDNDMSLPADPLDVFESDWWIVDRSTEPGTAAPATDNPATDQAVPDNLRDAAPKAVGRKPSVRPTAFSLGALVWGVLILTAGLIGVLAGTSTLTWGQAAPIALIVGGAVATIGLAAHWIRLARSRAAE